MLRKNYKYCSIISQNGSGGLYVGPAGAAYMLHHIAMSPENKDKRIQMLEEAETFITPALSYAAKVTDIADKTGFLTGNIGIYALATVIYKKLGNYFFFYKF